MFLKPARSFSLVRLLQTPKGHSLSCSTSSLPKSQVFEQIPDELEKNYKAAGILPFAKHADGTLILLGTEVRKGEWVISEFGGKRDRTDSDAIHTALREFSEETGGLFSEWEKELEIELRKPSTPKIWNLSGKYFLFPLQVPFVHPLPKWKEIFGTSKPIELGKTELHWIPAPSLQESILKRTPLASFPDMKQFRLFSFSVSSLRVPGVLDLIKKF